LALSRNDHATYEQRRHQVQEALAILDQRGGGSPRARACVLYFQGLLHHNHGRLELARPCFEEALGLHRGLGSGRGEARLLYQLGAVLIKQGRDAEAASMLQQALAIFRQHGDRVNGTPAEVYLGTALVHLGRYGQARPLLEPWMRSDFPFVRGLALRGVGELHSAQGRHDDACAALREALRLFCELGIPAEEAVTRRLLVALGDDGNRTHACKAHASPPPTA
jgi:predicted Zn-dependent protease